MKPAQNHAPGNLYDDYEFHENPVAISAERSSPSYSGGRMYSPDLDKLIHNLIIQKRQDSTGGVQELAPTEPVPAVSEQRPAAFEITKSQFISIYWIEFCVVFMLVGWNLTYLRSLLFPWKLLTVGFHESCHAIMATVTGARVQSIILDPNQGGATRMIGGWPFLSLPAGYIGSTTIGATLIFCGFDTFASKVVCIPITIFTFLLMYWGRNDWFTIVNISFPFGMLVIFFIIFHSALLRFYIIWIGVMNVMYAIWDILDDLVFQKIEESDCSAFTRLYPWFPAQVWGFIWFMFAFGALLAGTLGGLAYFKDSFAEQAIRSATFIPT